MANARKNKPMLGSCLNRYMVTEPMSNEIGTAMLLTKDAVPGSVQGGNPSDINRSANVTTAAIGMMNAHMTAKAGTTQFLIKVISAETRRYSNPKNTLSCRNIEMQHVIACPKLRIELYGRIIAKVSLQQAPSAFR